SVRKTTLESNMLIRTFSHSSILVPDNPGKTMGERLRYARCANGWSIVYLSQLSGVSATTISCLERGIHGAALSNIRRFAEVLDVSIEFLGCFENLPQKTLGQKIKKVRLLQGLQLNEFAALVGVDSKTVRSWERDDRIPSGRPSVVLNEILKALPPSPSI
ncbi:helix-turn-helix domain-containing protein, partial [Cohnella lubricantis]